METGLDESSFFKNTLTCKRIEQTCISVTLHQPEYMPPASTSTIHELIAQKANHAPGVLAVIHKKQSLTYAQLQRQANQLAHALLQRKIGPGITVGIYLPPSIDLLIAFLAILKAGACFLPLDVTLHPSLVISRLTSSKTALLLSHQKISKQLVTYRCDMLCLDRDQFLWIGESSSPPVIAYSEEQNACVLFCSDTSCQFRNISLKHAEIMHLLSHPFLPLCFDRTFFDLFEPLCRGDTIILC